MRQWVKGQLSTVFSQSRVVCVCCCCCEHSATKVSSFWFSAETVCFAVSSAELHCLVYLLILCVCKDADVIKLAHIIIILEQHALTLVHAQTNKYSTCRHREPGNGAGEDGCRGYVCV